MKTIEVDFNARSETGAIWLHTVGARRSVERADARTGDRVRVTDGEVNDTARIAEEDGVLVAILDDYRCFACGRRTRECAGGPSAEEAVQVFRWSTGVLDVDGRAGVACWPCFWRTDPDLWISAACWDALSPRVPAARLPKLVEDEEVMWDPASYAWPSP